jgi:hypothetical protein
MPLKIVPLKIYCDIVIKTSLFMVRISNLKEDKGKSYLSNESTACMAKWSLVQPINQWLYSITLTKTIN